MGLSVVQVAYALAPVSPDAPGGAEQIVSTLDAALAGAGVRSAVVALEGSSVAGRLFWTPRRAGRLDAAAKASATHAHAAAAARAVREAAPDVLHAHGIDFDAVLPCGGPPAIVTLHLPPAWYAPAALVARDGVALVCVSEAQAGTLPAGCALRAVVPNGVALDRFRPAARKDGFALVLARVCPEKGLHAALDAAREAGVPLRIGGAVFPYPEHLAYFEDVVRPRLDAERVFLGPVAGAAKAALLAAATCVVVPSLAPETSSLVAMEALASGTPVVARRVGALPEIVEDGVTGFLVDTDGELGPAMREARRLSPEACRRAAEERFDARRMVKRYLELYEEIAMSGRARGGAGKTARSIDSQSAVHPERSAAAPAAARSRGAVVDLDGLPALEALAGEWADLADRDPGSTPFQRPEWLLPYCRARGVRAPWAVTLRVRGRLAALAPLVVYEDAGRRVATLLGGGLSDWQDVLVDPDLAPDGGPRLLARMLEGRARFDVLLLERLRASSPLARADVPVADLSVSGDTDDDPCPALELAAPPAGVEAAIAPYLLQNARYGRRRLARMGDVRITRATAGDVGRHLDALVALHRARWEARGEPGVLATEEVLGLHRAAAPGLLARGLLRLHVLWVGARAAGALLGFVDRGWAAAYLSGFDPAFRVGSPGAVLFLHAIGEAAADGARTFDFLRGREPYKYDWGARDRPALRRIFRVAGQRSVDDDPGPARTRRSPECVSHPSS